MLPSSSSAAAAAALRLSRQRLPRAVVRRHFAASSSGQRTAVVAPRLLALAPPPRWTGSATRLSSTTASASSSTTATTAAPVRDFFLDNLGKIFLSIIAFIIASLVRSHYGGNNLKAVRDELEEASALDPMEIDELRRVNTELTPELYKKILNELLQQQQKSQMWTYEEFVTAVRTILRRELGPAGTIGLGYLLDRVVIAALQQYKLQDDDDSNNKSTTSEKETSLMTTESASFGSTTSSTTTDLQNLSMPLAFWMTVLSLALHGPVPDRIRVLYEVLQSMPNDNDNEHDNGIKTVTLPQVITMVGYLQETCQLVPDKQVIPTDVKYPTQQYRKGTPRELVAWDTAKAAEHSNDNNKKKDKDALDIDAFAEILRSKSVCAWGECYFKKKYVPA